VTPAAAPNPDTSTAPGFVVEGSAVGGLLKAFMQGRVMLMCVTAAREFQNALARHAGPREHARATCFMSRVTLVPDGPSPRVMALRTTKAIHGPDRMIFGTGDALSVVTTTADARFVRAAAAQGVILAVFLHSPARLQGQ
jgi:hypothetical protein